MGSEGASMDDIEAIGDAVTGGVIGRRVDPKAGEPGADGPSQERACLNCGCELLGDYCHCCGQQAHVHRTLRAFGHDLLHSALHLEGKIWKTLPLLVWKPGELTRRYIDGERAKFVSPIALFLFSVFLMFAVMGMIGALDTAAGGPGRQNAMASEMAEVRGKIASLEADRGDAIKEGRLTARIDERLTDARAELAAIGVMKDGKIDPSVVQASDDTPGWLRDFVDETSANP